VDHNNLAQAASNSGSLTYVASTPGSITITPTASGTSATIGGAAHLDSTSGATIGVFRLAAANAISPIDLGTVHVNGTFPTQAICIQNIAAADGYSEALDVSVGSVSGGAASNGGMVRLLAPGTVNGSIYLVLTSDGSGSSALGTSSLVGQSVPVTGNVFCGSAVWTGCNSGCWHASASWCDAGNSAIHAAPGLYAGFSDTVLLGSTTGSQAITLDGACPHIASLSFASGGYTLFQGSGGTICLDNGASAADVSATAGAQNISAPVSLISSAVFNVSGGLGLSTSGTIAGPPATLAIDGNNLVLNVVPEPETLLLLVAGFMFLAMRGARRLR
jgi:hypothetical protein